MPTITFEKEDVEALLGKRMRLEEMEDALLAAKVSVESVNYEDGRTIVEAEVGDTNRPDLWSSEGIARFLRHYLGISSGMPKYKVGKPVARVYVEKTVLRVRPWIACALVRDVDLGKSGYEQLIQLQEKLMLTYGRQRRKVAIGTSNADMIRFPVHYRGVDPHSARFVPLYENVEMDLAEILEKTEKGREYGHIIADSDVYPLLLDDRGSVISFPPIINSNDIGRIDARTRNIFIDVTGTDWRAVNIALNVIVCALVERGGSVHAVEIIRPEDKFVTPDLSPREIRVNWRRMVGLCGIDISEKEVRKLLERMGYSVKKVKGETMQLEYPAYRGDIMQERDVMEDLLIAYGFDNVAPAPPSFATRGDLTLLTKLEDALREILIGFGGEEVCSFILSSPETFTKAKHSTTCAQLENPVSERLSVLRSALIPVLLEFLSKNTSVPYPQRVFEVGDVVVPSANSPTGTITESHAAYLSAHRDATYTEVRQVLEAIFSMLGVDFSIAPADKPFFIPGRSAEFVVKGETVAYAGEIHPAVLEAFGILMPVSGFELNVTKLLQLISE